MAFASVTDLAALLRRSIDDEDAGALLALDLATGAIRNEARQHISLVEDEDIVLAGRWSSDLWLPERPVIEISSIEIVPSAGVSEPLGVTAYQWDGQGHIQLASGSWGGPSATVPITYTHGFETIPDDIRGLCLQVASRVFDNPGNVAQESIGSYSYSVSTASRTGVALSEDERRICWRYRRRTYP